MELKARALQESDWGTLQEWWKWWRWPEMSKDLLPMNGTGGLMICKGDIPIIAGFLYLTNSKGALLDWIISNPQYKEKDRKTALMLLIDSCEEVAKLNGYNIINNTVCINKYNLLPPHMRSKFLEIVLMLIFLYHFYQHVAHYS